MTEALMTTWSEVLADPCLQDLPYKIELNEDGKIVMRPAGKTHAKLQFALGVELAAQREGGQVVTEIAIQARSSARVMVADVAWISDDRWHMSPGEGPLLVAPEICVEIKSPSNSTSEMEIKTALYFDAGAEEVWIVTLEGQRAVHRRR